MFVKWLFEIIKCWLKKSMKFIVVFMNKGVSKMLINLCICKLKGVKDYYKVGGLVFLVW